MKTLRTLAAIAAFTILAPSANATTQIFFDDFSAESPRKDAAELTKWTVSSGRIDVFGPGYFDAYPGNNNYIDMDGSSANAGKITTKEVLSLMPGAVYTLSFSYGRAPESVFKERISFGIADWEAELTIPYVQIPSLLSFNVDFTVSETSGQLWINGFGGDNAGAIIDNVGLVVKSPIETTPVPVPASGLLLVAGVAGLGAIRRVSAGRQPRVTPGAAR